MNESLLELCGTSSGNLGSALLLLTAFFGCGRWILRFFLPKERRPHWILQLVLGMDVLALMVFAGAPLLSKVPAWGWVFLLLLPAGFGLAGIPLDAFSRLRRVGAWSFWPLVLMGLLLGSGFIWPFAWDEMVYQLALPVQWLHHGSIAVFADNPYSAFPSFGQFLWMIAIRIGGLGSVKVLVVLLYLPVLVWISENVRHSLKSSFAGALAASIFFFAPVTLVMMREAHVEVLILLHLSALYTFFFDENAPERILKKDAVLAGILCGCMVAIKATAFGGAAAAIVWYWGNLKMHS